MIHRGSSALRIWTFGVPIKEAIASTPRRSPPSPACWRVAGNRGRACPAASIVALSSIVHDKTDLVQDIATNTELSHAAANGVLDALIEPITQSVAQAIHVALVGFATFKSAKRAARTGKNPKTGEPLKIAATFVSKFSVGPTPRPPLPPRRRNKPLDQPAASPASGRIPIVSRMGLIAPSTD